MTSAWRPRSSPEPTSTMETNKASFSISSILAIIAAIFSFKVGAIGGLLLAALALFFGVLGMVLALLPNVRGGILSILAVILSLLGIVAAIIKAILWLI